MDVLSEFYFAALVLIFIFFKPWNKMKKSMFSWSVARCCAEKIPSLHMLRSLSNHIVEKEAIERSGKFNS